MRLKNTPHLIFNNKMKTLKLFNAVIAKKENEKPYVSELGFIIEPNAIWAKQRIVDYYTREQLNGNDLNKTFHKSWQKIKESTVFHSSLPVRWKRAWALGKHSAL
jgi:hypothetical protein